MAVKFGAGKAGAGAVAGKAAVAGKPKTTAKGSAGAGEGASLIPSEWVSGGLLNDVDVDIVDMTFVDNWTYNGSVDTPVLALAVTFHPDEGEDVVQHFSAGDLARWVPDPDMGGKRVIKAEGSTAKALNNNTNCATFLESLINAGFPLTVKGHEVGESVDVFEGCRVHVLRIEQKKRNGGNFAQAEGGRAKEVLTVSQIIRLPWEKEGTKKAAGKTTAKAVVEEVVEEEQETGEGNPVVLEAVGLVQTVLGEKGGKLAAGQLSVALLKHLQGNDNRQAIIDMVKTPAFLQMEMEEMGQLEAAPWEFDEKTKTLKAA